jgi:hypothetical protein
MASADGLQAFFEFFHGSTLRLRIGELPFLNARIKPVSLTP